MIKLSDEQLQTIELLTQLQGGFTFLTGKAGTGKSTVIKEYIKENKSVVLAPTGIAAVNIGGETIHSFFGLKARPFSPSYIHPLKPCIFEGFNTMIIDEISMVRVDLMTCIEQSLRYGDKLRRPFGGKKIIAVGDLRQLPPVVDSRKKEEIQFLRHHYGGKIYFHHASIFKQMDMVKKILKTVYRQSGDLEYLRILDQIGVGQQNGDTLIKINARVDRPCRNTIWICSTNYTVNKHNEFRLEQIKKTPHTFTANITGEFNTSASPSPETLILKEGCRVMFTKNTAAFVNGELGTVLEIYSDKILVDKDDGCQVQVSGAKWKNTKFKLSKNKELEYSQAGTFEQFPLKLAYAITIHKSQGLTFEKAHINVGRGLFDHGQLYVALSRIKSLEGLSLETRINPSDIIFDRQIATA